MTSDDTITIRVQNCTVDLFVGVHDHEKPAAQPVVISIEMQASLTQRYDDIHSHSIASVIDYDHVFHYITKELPKLSHVPLLESVGEKIIDFCFHDRRVAEVHVRLDKPHAYNGKAVAGIEMRRKRAGTKT